MTKRRRSPARPEKERGYQLGPEVWTRLCFTVFDAEGETVEGTPSEVAFVFGYGALLPALELALSGLVVGDRKTVELDPRAAYGPRDEKAEIEFDRSEFPSDVAEGHRYEVEREDGTPAVLRVLGVSDDAVLVDLNHPLAGQRVRFELEVLEARAATKDELELAEAALIQGADGGDEPTGEPENGPVGLLPAASLLRPGVRS